jgi:hypothetical protein
MSPGRRNPWGRIGALLRALLTPDPFVPLPEDGTPPPAPGFFARVFASETLDFEPPREAPAPRGSLLRRLLAFEDLDECVAAGSGEPGGRTDPQKRE